MKTYSENFLIGKELPWQEAGGGLSRQMMGFDGQVMLLKVKFEKGSIGYVHQHFHSQTSYVISGIFEVTIHGEKRVLKSGDGFFVEPNAPHGAVCIEEGILIDVFSPARQDFL